MSTTTNTATAHAPAKPLGPGALDGKRFLESLRDGRQVWLKGEKIADVTAHPAFSGLCAEMARIYDLQHAHETRNLMTYVNDNGVRVSYSYLEPRSQKDLLLRRRNAEMWSRRSYGMMG